MPERFAAQWGLGEVFSPALFRLIVLSIYLSVLQCVDMWRQRTVQLSSPESVNVSVMLTVEIDLDLGAVLPRRHRIYDGLSHIL